MSEDAKVLVVDDEGVVRKSCQRVLEQAGLTVDTASCGDEALRRLATCSYDLALLDLRMPGPGGLTLLRTIRSLYPDTEVVVMTGYPSIDNAKESILLGAIDFLCKPLDPPEILTVVLQSLSCRSWTLHKEVLP